MTQVSLVHYYFLFMSTIYQIFQKFPSFTFLQRHKYLFESDNLLTLQKVVNWELRKVRKWLEANRLSLNISKTSYVIFHSKARKINEFIRIKIGSKTIKRENCVKYPGILVDSTLTWKPHITQLSKKLSRSVGIFFKIRHYVTSERLKLLYYLLFYSLSLMVFQFGILLTQQFLSLFTR